MTATPIPRTLAMTVYGDLRVSIIDELPPGRKPVQTLHYSIQRRQSVNQFIRGQIQAGRQVYVVFPLIKENEKLDLQDLENGYNELCDTFPEYKISMVHGQMKAKDKDEQMQHFASGETQILVATTVIEVGVNVPNASVMIRTEPVAPIARTCRTRSRPKLLYSADPVGTDQRNPTAYGYYGGNE